MCSVSKKLSFFAAIPMLFLGSVALADTPSGHPPTTVMPLTHDCHEFEGWHQFDKLTPQQHAQIRELLRQARIADLKYRQEIMDQHFALQRLALEPEWNEQQATKDANLMAHAIAQRIVERMKLHKELHELLGRRNGAS